MKNFALAFVVLFVACGQPGVSVPGAACSATDECASGSVCQGGRCVALTVDRQDPTTPAAAEEETQAKEETPAEEATQQGEEEEEQAPVITRPRPIKLNALTYDTTFSQQGVFSHADESILDIAFFSNGDLAVLDSDSKIYRLKPDGTLDTTYGSSGVLTPDSTIAQILIRGDLLYALGHSATAACRGAGSSLAVHAFDVAGVHQQRFGSFGKKIVDIDARVTVGTGGALSSDAIYLSGYTTKTCDGSVIQDRGVIAKLNLATGALVTTFGSNGVAEPFTAPSRVTHVVPVLRTKVIAVGERTANTLLAKRLTTAGAQDATWAAGELAYKHEARATKPTAAGVLANGSVLILSQVTDESNWYISAIKFQSDGVPDTTFGNDGVAILQHDVPVAARTFSEQDGALFLGVNAGTLLTTTKAQLWKLTGAGALDTSFDSDGMADISYQTTSSKLSVAAIAYDAEGRWYAAGSMRTGSNPLSSTYAGKLARFEE